MRLRTFQPTLVFRNCTVALQIAKKLLSSSDCFLAMSLKITADLFLYFDNAGGQMVLVFTITKIKLFSRKRILRFGAVPFLFLFVVLSSLIALFALFTA